MYMTTDEGVLVVHARGMSMCGSAGFSDSRESLTRRRGVRLMAIFTRPISRTLRQQGALSP